MCNSWCTPPGKRQPKQETSRNSTYGWRHPEAGNRGVSICTALKLWFAQNHGPRVLSSAQMWTEVLKSWVWKISQNHEALPGSGEGSDSCKIIVQVGFHPRSEIHLRFANRILTVSKSLLWKCWIISRASEYNSEGLPEPLVSVGREGGKGQGHPWEQCTPQ